MGSPNEPHLFTFADVDVDDAEVEDLVQRADEELCFAGFFQTMKNVFSDS